MKFAFVEAEKASVPISRMCRILGVSQSGFFAWQERPACRRQQQDMVYLAHIRTAFALSNGTYGSPRMHRDLVDEGHEIGRHRTARRMRESLLIARKKRRLIWRWKPSAVLSWLATPRRGWSIIPTAGRNTALSTIRALLRKRDILISMSGRGKCYDNSMVETFFKSIKSELIWPVTWRTHAQTENAVARYFDGFYNPVRRHSSLGFQSPIAFEQKAREVS